MDTNVAPLATTICTPPYPDKFHPGDFAVSKLLVRFSDGDVHNIGDQILITKENVAYYNVCHEHYDKLDESPDALDSITIDGIDIDEGSAYILRDAAGGVVMAEVVAIHRHLKQVGVERYVVLVKTVYGFVSKISWTPLTPQERHLEVSDFVEQVKRYNLLGTAAHG